VTPFGKCFLGLLLLFHAFWAYGQEKGNDINLTAVLAGIEQSLNCSFTYADNDLNGHLVSPINYTDLESTIKHLEQTTAFSYTDIGDRTFAISKKDGALTRCIRIIDASDNGHGPLFVRTPYQLLEVIPGKPLPLVALDPSEQLHIYGEGIEAFDLKVERLPRERCLPVSVFSQVEFLEEVTLTNFLVRGITKNRSGSLTVNYEEFDILPGLIEPDVLLTIQALPGIQSVNETVSFLNIRGGTNDQNLILWDGIKMYQSGHFFGQISAFNPFMTKKAELIRNGSSAYYGDGVSGVISMQGDDALHQEVSGAAGINLISGDAYLNLPLGSDATLQLAGRKSYNNLFETPTYSAYFDKAFQNTEVISNNENVSSSDDDFSFFDAHIRLIYQPGDKDFLRVNFLALGNNLEFLESARLEEGDQSRQSELSQNNLSAGVYYKRQWNKRLHTDVLFYGTSYNLNAINADILNDQRLKQENDLLESGVKINTGYIFSKSITLLGGFQFNETGITNFEQLNDPFFELTDKQVLRTSSLFGEATWRPAGLDAVLTGGLRVNYISKIDELLLEPRFNFNLRFLPHFSLDIAAEIKSQSTSQVIDLQNDFLGIENRRWVLTNGRDIPLLKSRQVSTGINFANRGWLINLEPYLKEIDGITTQSQGFQNQFERSRTHGSYSVKGVDLLINKKFKGVTTWLGYSFAENQYNFPELDPAEFPNNIDVRHTLSYGINFSWNDLNLSTGLNWHTGKPLTNLVAGQEVLDGALNFSNPNQDNIDDYLRVDLSATYRFKFSDKVGAFAGISFWNLFNSNNEINRFYRLDAENMPETVVERSLRLTPNATFRLNF